MKIMVDEIIDLALTELNKEKNKEKILKPIVSVIMDKINPYILGTSIFFVTLILLILCILYLIISK
jgi:hypothetical protein